MAREYFCAYHSLLRQMQNLSDAECGRLFRALLTYSETGELINLQGREIVAFDFAKYQIDRDKEAYDAKCAQNAANVSKRYERKQSNTKAYGRTKEKGKEEIKENSSIRDVFAEFAGNDLALLGALEDFEQMRKQIKAPMTERAKELLCSKLEKSCSDNPTRIAELNRSILNGWKDVYPEQRKTNVKAPLVQSNAGDAEAAMVRRLASGL